MSWVAAGVAVASAGVKIYSNLHAKKKAKDAAKKIDVNSNARTEAQKKIAEENLFTLRNAYNAGVPGQALEKQEVIDAARNTGAAFEKNATSGSMRMQSLGGLQGQQDASMRQLGAGYGQQRMGLLGQLSSSGYGGMIDYERAAYADRATAQDALNRLQQTQYDAMMNIGDTVQGVGSAVAGGMVGNMGTKTKIPKQYGSGGMTATQYGVDTYKRLTAPRRTLTLGG